LFVVLTEYDNAARLAQKEEHTELRWRNLKERDRPEHLDVNGSIMSNWILKERGWKVVDWIELAQNRDRCRAVVNTVFIWGFYKMRGNVW